MGRLQRVLGQWLGLCLVGAGPVVMAAPGDTLYVQKPRINVRSGPGTDAAILGKLPGGAAVVEISRNGSWVNVSVPAASGARGWIFGPLLGPNRAAPGGQGSAAMKAVFDAFIADVTRLNSRAEQTLGFQFFTEMEVVGERMLQLTATDQWVASSEVDREQNLRTLVMLWRSHDTSDQPVSINIIDARGNPVLGSGRR